jgi:hypothetical protein
MVNNNPGNTKKFTHSMSNNLMKSKFLSAKDRFKMIDAPSAQTGLS